MSEEKYKWEQAGFRKDPYRVPEGYFVDFTVKMMEKLQVEPVSDQHRIRMRRQWMVWVSAAAAVLVIGWLGIRTYYWKPLQETRFQENIALMIDYYGEELHEGELAGFLDDNKIEMMGQRTADIMEVIQIEPDMTEEYIYESVGF